MQNTFATSMTQSARALADDMAAEMAAPGRPAHEEGLFLKSLEMSASEFHNIALINWKRARALIEHENQLVNHRMMWLLFSQGALLSAFGVLYTGILEGSRKGLLMFPLLVICLLGILICFNLFWNIKNAAIQMSRITNWWYAESLRHAKTDPQAMAEAYQKLNREHPPLHFWREMESRINHNRVTGIFLLRTEALPCYFVFLWSCLLVGAIVRNGYPEFWRSATEYMVETGFQIGGWTVLSITALLIAYNVRALRRTRRRSRRI